jgi:hypothetical protein
LTAIGEGLLYWDRIESDINETKLIGLELTLLLKGFQLRQGMTRMFELMRLNGLSSGLLKA